MNNQDDLPSATKLRGSALKNAISSQVYEVIKSDTSHTLKIKNEKDVDEACQAQQLCIPSSKHSLDDKKGKALVQDVCPPLEHGETSEIDRKSDEMTRLRSPAPAHQSLQQKSSHQNLNQCHIDEVQSYLNFLLNHQQSNAGCQKSARNPLQRATQDMQEPLTGRVGDITDLGHEAHTGYINYANSDNEEEKKSIQDDRITAQNEGAAEFGPSHRHQSATNFDNVLLNNQTDISAIGGQPDGLTGQVNQYLLLPNPRLPALAKYQSEYTDHLYRKLSAQESGSQVDYKANLNPHQEEQAVVQNVHDLKIQPSPQALFLAAQQNCISSNPTAADSGCNPSKQQAKYTQINNNTNIEAMENTTEVIIQINGLPQKEESENGRESLNNSQFEEAGVKKSQELPQENMCSAKNEECKLNSCSKPINSEDNSLEYSEEAKLDFNNQSNIVAETPTPETRCPNLNNAFSQDPQILNKRTKPATNDPQFIKENQVHSQEVQDDQQFIQGNTNEIIALAPLQVANSAQIEEQKVETFSHRDASCKTALNQQNMFDGAQQPQLLQNNQSDEEEDERTEYIMQGCPSMRIREDGLALNSNNLVEDFDNIPSMIVHNYHLGGAIATINNCSQRKIIEEKQSPSLYSGAHEESKSAFGEQFAIKQDGQAMVVIAQSNLQLPSEHSAANHEIPIAQDAEQENIREIPSNEAVSSQIREQPSEPARLERIVLSSNREEERREIDNSLPPFASIRQPSQPPAMLRMPEIEENKANMAEQVQINIGEREQIFQPPIHPPLEVQQVQQPDNVIEAMPLQQRSRSSSSSSDVSLSALSSPRSIPDEHRISKLDELIDGDQYINNYYCIMKGITWARDSHGLFDYETRHPLKKQMRTETTQMLVRTSKNNELHILPPYQDYKEAFQNQGQLLLTINKIRNHYYLEAPKMPKNDDLIPQYQSDDQPPANQNQENQQVPSEFTERMFLVVRSLKEGDKKLDYKLKKNDIIKLGRVKFKVKEIRIKALEDERNEKRKKKDKYMKKLREEEQKKLINEAAKAAEVRRNIVNQAQNLNYGSQPPQPLTAQASRLAPFKSESSIMAEGNEEEQESYIEVEAVMPLDQKKNQQEWKVNKLKQRKAQPALNNKNGMLTERIEGVAAKQATAKAEDATNFDLPQQAFNIHNQIRGINNTTSQNAVDQQPLEYGHEDAKHEDVKQEENNYSYRENAHGMNNRDENQLVLQTELNKNKSQNFVFPGHQSIKKSTQNNQIFGAGLNVTSNRRSGVPDDEQLVTKMDANEQREVTEMALKPNEDDEELIMRDDIDCESLNKELPFCRFCWVNDTSEENPLLSSCKCRGGVQYVHFSCLKEWVKTKRSAKEHAHISSYVFKQFECEICKTAYPYVFKAAGHRYKLIEFPCLNKLQPAAQPGARQLLGSQGDYLILESLTLEKNTSRIMHVITPTPTARTVRLGRGHDSDLRINDISVSRQHAVIRFKNDGFYLQDNMSKFGTLVLVRKRLPLSVSITQAVQVGRTVINFQIKPLPMPNFEVGKFIKSTRVLSEKDKQNEELRKVLVNMQQAEDYIKKQQAEHQRLARTDNFHQRNDYQRRVQQNIHEEEIKIDPSVEQLANVAGVANGQLQQDSLRLNVNRILEQNQQRRQELLNYMQNNHGGAINGINGLLQAGQPGALVQPGQIPPLMAIQPPVNPQQSQDDNAVDNMPVPDEELGGVMNQQLRGHIIQAREPAQRQVNNALDQHDGEGEIAASAQELVSVRMNPSPVRLHGQ